MSDWFTSWFDTPYYHILYKHRDYIEAEYFIKNLTSFLNLKKDSHIADLPCGKGRHAIFLNSLGYKVTAGDLSSNSIKHAKTFENDRLTFEVWDMRRPLEHKYDAVFNLFTSFGYFNDDNDDISVLKSMKCGLKKDGVLVIDFLNVNKVKDNLITSETKSINGIDFHIKREISNGFILKHISFYADAQKHSYTEQVKIIDLEKFNSYFSKINMKIIHTFGDYSLNEFDTQKSDRLILVVK